MVGLVFVVRSRFTFFTRAISCIDGILPREKENTVFFFHSHSRLTIKSPKYFSCFPSSISSRCGAFYDSVLFQDLIYLSFVRGHISSRCYWKLNSWLIYLQVTKNFLRGKFSCIICTQLLWKFLHKRSDGSAHRFLSLHIFSFLLRKWTVQAYRTNFLIFLVPLVLVSVCFTNAHGPHSPWRLCGEALQSLR